MGPASFFSYPTGSSVGNAKSRKSNYLNPVNLPPEWFSCQQQRKAGDRANGSSQRSFAKKGSHCSGGAAFLPTTQRWGQVPELHSLSSSRSLFDADRTSAMSSISNENFASSGNGSVKPLSVVSTSAGCFTCRVSPAARSSTRAC